MTSVRSAQATEVAYREIRQRIVDAVYRPGSRLREAALATSLELSRTPVRSALVRLGVEGLVELIPNHGAFVAKWSATDVEEIFGLRIALEPIAAGLAARKVGVPEIEELSRLAAAMDDALEKSEDDDSYVDASTELNARFHRILIDGAHNHQLRSMLSAVIEFPLMHRTIHEFEPNRLHHAWTEHRELIEAMRRRDHFLAEAVMRTHVLAARDVIRRMLDRDA